MEEKAKKTISLGEWLKKNFDASGVNCLQNLDKKFFSKDSIALNEIKNFTKDYADKLSESDRMNCLETLLHIILDKQNQISSAHQAEKSTSINTKQVTSQNKASTVATSNAVANKASIAGTSISSKTNSAVAQKNSVSNSSNTSSSSNNSTSKTTTSSTSNTSTNNTQKNSVSSLLSNLESQTYEATREPFKLWVHLLLSIGSLLLGAVAIGVHNLKAFNVIGKYMLLISGIILVGYGVGSLLLTGYVKKQRDRLPRTAFVCKADKVILYMPETIEISYDQIKGVVLRRDANTLNIKTDAKIYYISNLTNIEDAYNNLHRFHVRYQNKTQQ